MQILLGSDFLVRDEGVEGETLATMAGAVGGALTDAHDDRLDCWLLLSGGTNDISHLDYDADTLMGYVESITSQAHDAGFKVVWETIPPPHSQILPGPTEAFQNALRDAAPAWTDGPIIDVSGMPPAYTHDGTHPDQRGYTAIGILETQAFAKLVDAGASQ
jgi:hypothetical protein